ncbi:hypothetical protein KLER11_gp31 [Pararheinheimera phage vB_PsoM_KLER1-1]|nr:hypothetical protein KLER11_gp31 [Pararheinheimera phage vB_PsoM_KLER1-1]
MTYQDADLIKFAVLLAACWFNPVSAFVLMLHVISVFMLLFINYNPVGIYCLIAVLYCAASCADIKISSSIRYVLYSIGLVKFGAGIEFYLFEYQTIYYKLLPSVINALDLLTLIFLLTGGRGFAGLYLLHSIRLRLTCFNIRYFSYNHIVQRQTIKGETEK